MAFTTRLQTSGACVFFWAEVDGANALWFNRTPPTNWSLASGAAVYTTLAPPSTWQGLESRVEPFAGVAPSGRLTCTFRLTPTHALASEEAADPWLDYVANDVTRGPITVLTADLTATGTTMTVDDTTDFASSGILHLGSETVLYSGKTSTTFTGLTRAQFGTQAQYHVGSLDQVYEVGYGGGYVADRMISLHGRRLRVYCGTGFMTAAGDLIAYGADEDDTDDNRLIFSGYVRDVQFDGALAQVAVTAESLRSALARECATRLPRGVGGGGSKYIYLSDDNNRLSWGWLINGVPSGSDYNYTFADTRLQRDDGAAGTENVPDGWYHWTQIAAYIAFTMDGSASMHPDENGTRSIVCPISDTFSCSIGLVVDEERGGRYALVEFAGTLTTLDYAHQLGGGNPSQDLMREFGFTDPQASFAEYLSGSRDAWSFAAPRLLPYLRIPEGRRGRAIVYRQEGTLAFQTTTGFVDDDGAAVPAYARIGEEVVRIGATSTNYSDKTLTITGRGQLGSRPAEVYIEDTRPFEAPETVEIVQGVVLPSVSWGNAVLQLAMSGNDGTGYDRGWRGSGAGLDESIFDTDTFLELGSAKRDICRFEPFELDDLLANEAVAARCAVVEYNGQITLRSTEPALEVDTATATLLDTSNLLSLGGPGVKMSLSESRIVNKIVATDLGYNPGTDKAAEKITWKDGTSAGTWGDAKALTISLRNVAGREAARATVLGVAQVAAASWSRPVYALDLTVALPEVGWTIDTLDEVRITHPLILERAAPGRGVTELAGRVYGVRPTWRGDGTAALVRVICYSTAARYSAYAPTAYVSALPSSTRLRVDDFYDSRDDSGIKDAERFAAGYRVRIYTPGGSSSGAESRIVDSITLSGTADQSEIVVTAAVGVNAPCIVEFDAYDTSGISDDQLKWVYISDGDGVLGSGTDKAFIYV